MKTSKEIKTEIDNLNTKRDEILEKVFKYDVKFRLTEEEKDILHKAFVNNPEFFPILRKALEIYTLNEVGLVEDIHSFDEVNHKVSDRIKKGLSEMYVAIQSKERAIVGKDFDDKEKQLNEELKEQEENEKATEDLKRQEEIIEQEKNKY